MAEARMCDRCGRFYKMDYRRNRIVKVGEKRMDLCDDCWSQLNAFMEKPTDTEMITLRELAWRIVDNSAEENAAIIKPLENQLSLKHVELERAENKIRSLASDITFLKEELNSKDEQINAFDDIRADYEQALAKKDQRITCLEADQAELRKVIDRFTKYEKEWKEAQLKMNMSQMAPLKTTLTAQKENPFKEVW